MRIRTEVRARKERIRRHHTPLQTTDLINSYLRYREPIYPFQEQDLRAQFWRALETPELLVKAAAGSLAAFRGRAQH